MQLIYRIAFRILYCYWFLVRPNFYGAYVGLWYGNQILMIKNSYRRVYTVPSGKIDRKEAPVDAAVRELSEEVGIRLAPEQLSLAGRFTIFHEYKHDHISFYEVHLDQKPSFRIDNREVAWARFLPVSEAERLNLSPVMLEYFSKYATFRNREPVVS